MSGLDGQQVKAVHVKCDFDRGEVSGLAGLVWGVPITWR